MAHDKFYVNEVEYITENKPDISNISLSDWCELSNVLTQNNITFTHTTGDYFGSLASPRTGTLTFDATGAVTGGIATVWYQNPTLDIPSTWVVQGTFDTTGVNKLYFEIYQ